MYITNYFLLFGTGAAFFVNIAGPAALAGKQPIVIGLDAAMIGGDAQGGLAIEQAKSTDRVKIRAALESLPSHRGVMRNYAPPFTPDRHYALDAADFRLSEFNANGTIVPVDAR